MFHLKDGICYVVTAVGILSVYGIWVIVTNIIWSLDMLPLLAGNFHELGLLGGCITADAMA